MLHEALRAKAYGFIHLTGGMQLGALADLSGKAYYNVALHALSAAASRAEGGQFADLNCEMARSFALPYFAIAKNQHSENESSRKLFQLYGDLLGLS